MNRADANLPLNAYREYGPRDSDRFRLMRRVRGQAARWWDTEAQEWVGPEQRNVTPAVAWALSPEAPFALRLQEMR